jgi:hypothetical protein
LYFQQLLFSNQATGLMMAAIVVSSYVAELMRYGEQIGA